MALGMASMAGVSTFAITSIAISTSSIVTSSGGWAEKAKGNSSSTVLLMNRGEPRSQAMNSNRASTGAPMIPKRIRRFPGIGVPAPLVGVMKRNGGHNQHNGHNEPPPRI